MTKTELVEKIAAGTKLSKSDATQVLNVIISGIKGSLKKGQKVTLVGFGTFSVSNRKARTGRNPRTGEAIKIPATKVPRFIAAQGLKDVVK
jgi:nucleoid DNA-binding protein